MKASSGHLVLDEGVEYRDLVPVFPEILTTFLQESGQVPDDPDILNMFINLNQVELERNCKPEGYNRKGRMRLVFPLEWRECYLPSMSKSNEAIRSTEKISRMLNDAKVGHQVEWNKLYFNE